jgi:hypothetical protein
MANTFIADGSESSEVTRTAVAPSLALSEILSSSTGKHTSEKNQDYRRKNAYKWYKLFASPTRETMRRIVEYTKGPNFTRQDVDLLPWNFEETEVTEEAMKSPKKFIAVGIPEEGGVRDHVNLYSQEHQRNKKEIEKREKLEVQKLDHSMTDVSGYQSPTRNTKKFHGPVTMGKMNILGAFSFEAEEGPVESSARIVGKESGHATSRDFISNVAANPARRPVARRHSLMAAKDIELKYEKITNDGIQASNVAASPVRRPFSRSHSLMTVIEHEKNANDDFQANSLIASPTKFHRSSVGTTSRPGLPPLIMFDNDGSIETNSGQARVKELDFSYGTSNSKYSVSKEGDDDDASIYMLDEDDDDSVAEVDQEPAYSDDFDAVRILGEDVDLYSQEYQRNKKEIERREKLEVQKLDHSMTDISGYQSPTRNAKKFYDPATIGRIDSPGIFSFEGKKSGHASSTNFNSNVAASPARRPFLRSHSLMTVKDIELEYEKITNDDIQANSLIASPTKFHRSSVGTTSRPGLPPLIMFDNDGSSKTKSGQAHVKELKFSYGASNSRYPVSKEGDDDDASIYMLDEDDGNSVAEADQKPAYSNGFAVRISAEDVNLYSQEDQRSKKEIERRGKLEVQKLDHSMTDVSGYQSPTRNAKKFYGPATIGRIDSPGIFNFEAEEGPVESVKRRREEKANLNSLRPGMMRGTSFNNYGDNDVDEGAVSRPMSNMRPGLMRGCSFDEDDPLRESFAPRENSMRSSTMRELSFDGDDAPEKLQEVKDAEENKAKVELAELLDQDSNHEKAPVYLKSFSSLRKGYISAVDKLRPQSKPFLVHTRDDRNKEANKVKEYDALNGAWDTYEDTAQDKPNHEDFSPEQEAAEEKAIEVETAVNKDWQEYAEVAVKVIHNDDGSDDGEEYNFWVLEARRLKAEVERKKAKEEKKRKKREKKKRRKEKEAQQKRLVAADRSSVRLKEETCKKKEEGRKAKPSKTKEGSVDSNDTESVGKSEFGVEEERRQKREAAKTKDTSRKDVKNIVVGSSEDARRRQLAFRWYSQMQTLNRSDFKQQVAALSPLNLTPNDVTPEDVDLLPWNATGSMVNIAEMNALTRASIMKPKQ